MALFNRKRTGDAAEMSFIDHLEVLRGHLLRSVIAIIVGGIVVAVYNDFFIKKVLMGPTHNDFPTYAWLCKAGRSFGMGDALCMKITPSWNLIATEVAIGVPRCLRNFETRCG